VSARKVYSLDAGWLFHLGDIETPLRNAHIAAYMANKAGWARGAAKGDYDDSDWREISLPHDWSIEGKFDPANHLDNGYLPRGIAWYRRHFRLEESSRGKYLALQVDGVATHCTVYVNGHCVHRNFCGYTPFTIDITDIANFGDDLNTVAVRVDATTIEGWWYEGAGIYRHVWMIDTNMLHVATDGVFVRPERNGDDTWSAHVATGAENRSDAHLAFTLTSEIVSRDGAIIGTARSECSVEANSAQQVRQEIVVRNPELWTLGMPAVYQMRTRIEVGGERVDEYETTFGFRTIRFDAGYGFFLNGESVKLIGTCNHQDHAGVGVAVPDSIWEFRVGMLKEMGCNAYRCAHNPPAKELLDACDRLGMLVMDENRNFGSSPEHLRQLETMVKRDRNHPSVMLWSICNEEAIQASHAGEAIARTMAEYVRELDPSRPITAAVSGGVLGEVGIGNAIDVMGINYQIGTYDAYHAKHPGKPLIAAETHSTFATRGVYETDAEKKYFSSRDDEKAAWGATARETVGAVWDRDFVAGFFAWTGFDYRGEPTPHEWPCVNSHFGILDICGFPKDSFYLHKSWFTEEPFVHLLPHWNWKGREGEEIEVEVYTNCCELELLLNDELLGRKEGRPIENASWRVPYCAGELKAVGYRSGESAATAIIRTTGPAAGLGLEIPETFPAGAIPADGAFTIPITVFAMDAGGLRVPTANHFASFTVTGPAKILGAGNGDPTCHEHNQSPSRALFNGLAQVLVQTTRTVGEICLTASAGGLAPATLRFASQPAPQCFALLLAKRRWLITGWRMSPISATRPDPAIAPSEQDMNTWERITLDAPQKGWEQSTGYVIYRATFTTPKFLHSTGGHIILPAIHGSAEAFLDGQRVEIRINPNRTRSIAFRAGSPAGSSRHSIAILLHSGKSPAGIVGPIELTE
jgi:beta-galactosidase